MRVYLRDQDGKIVAFRGATDNEWSDPYGGAFSARDQEDMTALAEGTIDDFEFGCPGMRITIRFEAGVETSAEWTRHAADCKGRSEERARHLTRYHEVFVLATRAGRTALDPVARLTAPRWAADEAKRAVGLYEETLGLAELLGDDDMARSHRASIAELCVRWGLPAPKR